jgi:hypothetical protein
MTKLQAEEHGQDESTILFVILHLTNESIDHLTFQLFSLLYFLLLFLLSISFYFEGDNGSRAASRPLACTLMPDESDQLFFQISRCSSMGLL